MQKGDLKICDKLGKYIYNTILNAYFIIIFTY